MNYQEALARDIAGVPTGSDAEQAAVARFGAFFAKLSEEAVRDRLAETYAENVWFNDTLKTVEGRAALEEYFLVTVRNGLASAVVDQHVRAGDDHYFRWRMEIRFRMFRRGRPQQSIGITHVRFNQKGLIVLHQDYWDSAAGFFVHVPVVGWGIRWISGRL